jgi:hypothetical protein
MPDFPVETHFLPAQTPDLALDLSVLSEVSDVQTVGHNNAFLAATHPTPAPLQTNQVSQAVTLKEILKLKTKMNELAVKVASFTSEPFEKYVLSQAELESMVSPEDRKEILDDKIASLERILHSKTAPAAPPQAKQETAPIMGPMHDAGYASTYAATVLSKQAVPPDQRQTKTNDCGQIKDLKWNIPCRANYVPKLPLNDGGWWPKASRRRCRRRHETAAHRRRRGQLRELRQRAGRRDSRDDAAADLLAASRRAAVAAPASVAAQSRRRRRLQARRYRDRRDAAAADLDRRDAAAPARSLLPSSGFSVVPLRNFWILGQSL